MKMSIIAQSSAKVEFYVMVHTTCKMMLFQSLLAEIGVFWRKPMMMYRYNQAAMYLIHVN